ncbi:transglutaminase family protein [Roseibium salinum]|uniref:Transglutaminase family protein n=1 Tax=Roseibium salinum TaxID=1604349 RepID=A0ABT3R8C1_9HYPH|nr:transglutaminase family protein [Roseibium sp. DSM 29163]MCX2725508.1 transglutaminase family protein [Roseibium sp. DSM 29163]MDN3720704.1 transglutaminase family protein [Roseibium salinum]
MLYDVTLEITYDYASPANHGRHALRLMPATCPGEQTLLSGRISLQPEPWEREDRVDFFGNAVTDVAYRKPHRELLFKLQARIDRTATPEQFDISPSLKSLARELATIQSLKADEPVHFLSPSPRLALDPAFAVYAEEHVSPGMSAISAVETIGKALHDDMHFDARATTVDTPALEAFESRHGVCQDFTHIMIACLRSIGIPAGYVSGFLRTTPPPGRPRLEGADAMHAWVRAWCGIEVGWIEYDPTNAVRVGQDHIVVARGRDYGDVSPVKGVSRTAGGQTTDHRVDVIPL